MTTDTKITLSAEQESTLTATTKEQESTMTTDWEPTSTATTTATSDWEPTSTDTTTEREPTSAFESADETTTSWSKPVATTEETQTTDQETHTTDEQSAFSSSSEFDNSHLSSYLSSIIYTDSTAANQQQTTSDAITTDMTTAVNNVPTTDATSAPAAAATSHSLEAIANIVSQTDTMTSTASKEEQTTFAAAETSLDTTPTKSSSFIYYPSSTRSFSVTSSTATPMLVLGATECVDDPHAVDGKCTYEYFCNAATHSCVFLLEDNSACYEDFQCASTYCTDHICVAAPESKQSGQGGKIAGSIVGSVAGAAVLLFGLIRWRKRSQTINRRMNKFQSNHHNEKPAFYDATTTILPASINSTANASDDYHNTNPGNARLSKYNFLAHMLNPEPPMTAPPPPQPPYASNTDHFTIPVAATERGAAAVAKQADYNPFRDAAAMPDPWMQEDYQSLKKPENKTVYSYI